MFKIKRSTLEDQYKRAARGPVNNGAPKILDDNDLSSIATWIDERCKTGDWPTLEDVEEFTSLKLHVLITNNTLYKTITSRMPNYDFVIATPMEEERVSSSDDEIYKFYDDLEALLPFVDYRFCYNLDETGHVDAKDTQAIHVIVPKTIKKEAMKLPFDRSSKRFTILHTISTDGKLRTVHHNTEENSRRRFL